MIIVEDTRNQIGKHKLLNDEFNKMGYAVLRSKLFVGDYARLDNQTVCVDTKKDWAELGANICGRQHERFRNECLRAKMAEIKLIVLVEEEIPVEQWLGVKRANKRVEGVTLAKAMKTMSEKYGVKFLHCKKSETAKKIVKILEEI